MKLIHHTIGKLSVVMIVVLTVWAGIFYFNIFDEVWDETDDSLENFKTLIIRQFMLDTTSLNLGDKDLMSQYRIRQISEEEAVHYQERHFDSTRFYEAELDFDPIRVLKTAFRGPNNRYYELTVQISTMEQDDMLQAILVWVVALYASLLICLIIVSQIVFRKSWRPFYRLMGWLREFTLGGNTPPLDNPTKVKEFQTLNETISQMTRRSEKMYDQQRQFIENASHELQTPLAICQNKLELLAENTPCNEEQLREIGQLHDTLRRAIQLNKSLLLLSRIENGQFHETHDIDMNRLVRETAEDFNEIYEHKEIRMRIEKKDNCHAQMNDILAHILVSNLIKNAMTHTPPRGKVDILVTENEILFSNTSDTPPLDSERVFTRFYQSDYRKKDSTGLGLAIVKSIADSYRFRVEYFHDGRHNFRIRL